MNCKIVIEGDSDAQVIYNEIVLALALKGLTVLVDSTVPEANYDDIKIQRLREHGFKIFITWKKS